MTRQYSKIISKAILVAGLLAAGKSTAGVLDPTNAPGPTMHTLEEIYQKVDALVSPQTLSDTTTVVNTGYYIATTLTAVDADLVSTNIKAGVTLFGVVGNDFVVDTASGDATAEQIFSGRIAYVAGAAVTGTVETVMFSADNSTVVAGYYASTNLTAVDVDLVSTNIKAGVTIFGVVGDTNVVDTSTLGADATAGDITLGKKAWVNGVLITGERP